MGILQQNDLDTIVAPPVMLAPQDSDIARNIEEAYSSAIVQTNGIKKTLIEWYVTSNNVSLATELIQYGNELESFLQRVLGSGHSDIYIDLVDPLSSMTEEKTTSELINKALVCELLTQNREVDIAKIVLDKYWQGLGKTIHLEHLSDVKYNENTITLQFESNGKKEEKKFLLGFTPEGIEFFDHNGYIIELGKQHVLLHPHGDGHESIGFMHLRDCDYQAIYLVELKGDDASHTRRLEKSMAENLKVEFQNHHWNNFRGQDYSAAVEDYIENHFPVWAQEQLGGVKRSGKVIVHAILIAKNGVLKHHAYHHAYVPQTDGTLKQELSQANQH